MNDSISRLTIEDFDYFLPESLIAQAPLARRDESRLLVADRATGHLSHRRFCDLADYLKNGDLLVVNETRVLPARLLARRPTGGSAELLLVRPAQDGAWLAMVRPSARIKPATSLTVFSSGGQEMGPVIVGEPAGEGMRLVHFPDQDVESLLDRAGHVPLPPYIRREDVPGDRQDYQTVYARVPGAVAAPTAGLHFTGELLQRLDSLGVTIERLVLHVGPGTFRPVQVSDYTQHRLEAEWCEITAATAAAIRRTKAEGGRVIAVGTTSTRALESVARRSPAGIEAYSGWVDIFIHPPFDFHIVDVLITNFHLPKSTLLLLVSALAGREFLFEAYAEAVRESYRFYSYGDAMLIT